MSKAVTGLEQLRDQPDHELRQALARTRDELFRLHLAQHTNQVTSTAELLSKRREIARILTILRARALRIETQGQKTQDRAPRSAKPSKTQQAKP
jgi:large subunit ribosomal protein L29